MKELGTLGSKILRALMVRANYSRAPAGDAGG
jgi:hypothetical protein